MAKKMKRRNNCTTRNFAKVAGKVIEEPKLIVKKHNELFLEFFLRIKRKNQKRYDEICVIAPKNEIQELRKGDYIRATGEIASYDSAIGKDMKHLNVYIKANEVRILPNETYNNIVVIKGFNVRPTLTKCISGGRKLTQTMISVKGQEHCKQSYIPIISWDDNALRDLSVGSGIYFRGSLTSRTYHDKGQKKIVYRVCIHEFLK